MTAGVQNLESSAYLPPPPSTSASDTKGTGTQGDPQSFQSELERQDPGTKETKSSGRPESGPGKSTKKRDVRAEDANQIALLPVQVAEPQKQILPLVLTLAKPDDEQVKLDEHTKPGEQIKPGGQIKQDENAKTSVPTENIAPPVQSRPSDAPGMPSAEPNPIPVMHIALPATADSSQAPIVPIAVDAPAPKETTTSAKTGMSPQNQPISRAELKLPDAAPPEPAAAAVQETVDSTPSSPSALAFAARLTAAPQTADQGAPENPAQPAAVPDSQTPARIPVRYAATAQILQNAEAEIKPGLKKNTGAAFEGPARTDARLDTRTDMVLPRLETSRDAAPSSRPATPQYVAPPARTEHIIEPPAAPPTSARDIRVRVPDNNGGSTQVRFVESGGEVRVSVRTADAALAQNLRSHLSDLTQRLADGGMPAEIWKPGSAAASSQNDNHQPDREGRGSDGQRSGQQGEQQDRQKRPAWLDEMEASLHGSQD
ncbi:MAG: hypothetical protein JWO19_2185 [Bryobacterales bacterium]|nr:hypothetical protein [Bryobacterales bacterium]